MQNIAFKLYILIVLLLLELLDMLEAFSIDNRQFLSLFTNFYTDFD